MQPIALLLILVSAVIHVGWNTLGKRSQPSGALFLAANLVGCLCLLPGLAYHIPKIPAFLAELWPLLTVSGCATVIYYRSLAAAYNSGDLSLAYPLSRSSPLFIVAVMFLLGRGAEISPACLAGIVLVLAGCILLPMRHMTDLKGSHYLSRVFLAALLAALATTAYSIADEQALRLLVSGRSGPLSNLEASLVYAALWALSSSALQAAVVLARKPERATFLELIRRRARIYIPLGLGINLGYVLILAAMTWSHNVSYVVAFRQVSIPLGALLGIFWLKEPLPLPKGVGLLILLIGLTLVAVG
ncbi:MAG: multidrug DMT transporter permease [Acidobacteriota bacterium]|nr:multidrug DMT transporter permease [Acidobacteriota bacterium]